VILATGAQARWLGMPSEEKFKALACRPARPATDFSIRQASAGGRRRQHRGREALFLTNFASEVTIVHRAIISAPSASCRSACSGTPRSGVWTAPSTISAALRTRARSLMSAQERQERRADQSARGRRLHCDRPRAGDRTDPRPDQAETIRLCRVAPNSTATWCPRVAAATSPTKPTAGRDGAGLGVWPPSKPNASSPCVRATARRRNNHGSNPRRIYGYGLGQTEGVSRRGGSWQFTHAGEQLGLSQSAVSRQVSALEQELSVSLFHRHARAHPHRTGRPAVSYCHDVFMQLQARGPS